MAVVTEEYYDLVSRSLRPALILVPSGCKLLFEGVVEARRTVFGTLAGLYYECFLLVAVDASKEGRYVLLREALFLRHPEMIDLPLDYRCQKVEGWLMRDFRDEPKPFEYLDRTIQEGLVVYVPNRFPKKFCIDGELISFLEIL